MLENRLKKLIPLFRGKKILIVGDLMLDEHIWSKVNRISPEAPVVIADVQKITHVPGGCGNVAANVKALGGTPLLAGLAGHDSSGDKLISALRKLGIATNLLIRDNKRPTALKSRIIAGSQQVVRVDRENKEPLPHSLAEKILKKALGEVKKSDAVIISDYGKGMLTAATCHKIIAEAKRHKKPVLIDPKGQDYKKYHGASIITPNLAEAEQASGIKINDGRSLIKAGQSLLKLTGSDHILVTRGENGMSLFTRGGFPNHIPAVPREVFDITGAGDTVIATLALAFSAKVPAFEAALLSNFAGSVKVTKIATQPVSAVELASALEEKEPASKKIKTRKELAEIVRALKNEGARIVFTNGCFDVLHLGHVRYLKEAKKLGDVLILGLNSDASVRALKGPTRPYISEHERAEILASLESIDYVTIFGESRPDNLIKLIKPAIHVKGGDYKVTDLPERKLVKELGGRVVVIPPTVGKSTTNLIEKILGRKPA